MMGKNEVMALKHWLDFIVNKLRAAVESRATVLPSLKNIIYSIKRLVIYSIRLYYDLRSFNK